jgi:lysophospholipase L1-like esterase
LPCVGTPVNADPSRPFDNMGATGGMRVNDLLTISGLASCQSHPLAITKNCARMNETLQDRGTALSQTLEQLPTFVMLWIGGNDALEAVTTATVIEGVTLTPAAEFETDYRAVTDAIAASGADMVLANVVGVPGVPFANTVPPIVIDPITREPVLIMGQTVPLLDSSGASLSPTDRVTLFGLLLLDPAFMDGGTGCGVPDIIDGGFDSNVCPNGGLPDEVVLTAAEAAQIDNRIDEYNAVIETVAQETGSALVDAHALFDEWATNGVAFAGLEYNLDFLTGGLISYDGVHPSPLANALATNEFILAINSTYGAQIPLVDLFPFVARSAGSLAPPLITPEQCEPLTLAETFGTMRDGLGLPTDDELRLLGGSDPGPEPGRNPGQRSRRRLDRDYR